MLNSISKKIIFGTFIVLFFVLLVFSAFIFCRFCAINNAYRAQQSNERILAFTDMFVRDVLLAEKEINFDTRLSLETAVRSLNDEDIFKQWQKFTKCSTKEEASSEVKVLLGLLIKKIKE